MTEGNDTRSRHSSGNNDTERWPSYPFSPHPPTKEVGCGQIGANTGGRHLPKANFPGVDPTAWATVIMARTSWGLICPMSAGPTYLIEGTAPRPEGVTALLTLIKKKLTHKHA